MLRGLARATACAARPAIPRAGVPLSVARPLAQHLGSVGLVPRARTYVTANKYTRDEVAEKVSEFHAEVFSANWGDYLYLVYNMPFWEAEFEKLSTVAQPYLHEKAIGGTWSEVQEMMDCLYQCEDVRDHLNELAELVTRASGFMGTGIGAEEKVDNMDENAEACAKAYEAILAKHPSFKPKIEQSIGHGLAILRQKHKFKWGTMHRYFF